MDFVNNSIVGTSGLPPLDSWYSYLFYPGSSTAASFVKATRNGDNYYVSRLNDPTRLNPNVSYFVRLNKDGQWDNVFTITNGGNGSAYYSKVGSQLFCATRNTFSVLNEDLSLVWSRTFASNTEFKICAVETDSDGRIYIAAEYWYATVEFAALFICLNSSGALQWCKRFRVADKNVVPTAIKKSSTTLGTDFLCVTFNRRNIYFSGNESRAYAALINKSDGSLVRQGFFTGAIDYYYIANDVEYNGLFAYVAGHVTPVAGGNRRAWTSEYKITDNSAVYSENSNTLEQSGVNLSFNGIKFTGTHYKCVGGSLIVEYEKNASSPASQYIANNFNMNLSGIIDYSGGTYFGDLDRQSIVIKGLDNLSRPRSWSGLSLSTTTYTDGGPSDFYTSTGVGLATFEDFSSIAISNHTPVVSLLSNQLTNSFSSNASNSG